MDVWLDYIGKIIFSLKKIYIQLKNYIFISLLILPFVYFPIDLTIYIFCNFLHLQRSISYQLSHMIDNCLLTVFCFCYKK